MYLTVRLKTLRAAWLTHPFYILDTVIFSVCAALPPSCADPSQVYIAAFSYRLYPQAAMSSITFPPAPDGYASLGTIAWTVIQCKNCLALGTAPLVTRVDPS